MTQLSDSRLDAAEEPEGINLAKAEIVLYQSDGSNVPVEVRYLDETFWLTQREMAELFDVDRSVITKHLRNVFDEGELEKESTSANIALVRTEGSRQVKRQVEIYNLDAIIAVGYRVNSLKATRFRQWATRTLKEYIVKGFVLNDDMLKNGAPFGQDYFDELLARIRDCADALDGFLRYARRDVLEGKGTRTHAQAKRKALDEFAKFQKVQDATFENDFEREMRRIEERQS